jgi:hypothetical protein
VTVIGNGRPTGRGMFANCKMEYVERKNGKENEKKGLAQKESLLENLYWSLFS